MGILNVYSWMIIEFLFDIMVLGKHQALHSIAWSVLSDMKRAIF